MNVLDNNQDAQPNGMASEDSGTSATWSLERVDHPLGGVIPITQSLTLGRDPACDVVLLSDTSSRKHARLFLENDLLYIEDLGSRNGTYKNGTRTDGKTELQDGDRLRLDKENFSIKNHSDVTLTAMNMIESSNPMGPGGTVMVQIERDSREGGTAIFQEISVDRPSLVGVSSPYAGQVFDIAQQEVTIGRAPHNAIVLDESAVSLDHARIKYENDQWQIIDLMSANGTFVNARKITQMFLNPGDIIKVGPIELRFSTGHRQGRAASAPMPATRPVSTMPQEKKPVSLWVFIVAGFLLALAGAGAWLFFNQ